MKEKIKSFFGEKKELMVFVGILSLVFIAVITIATLALKADSDPVIVLPPDPTDTGVIPDDEDKVEVATFGLPVKESAIMLRCYYDDTKGEEELISASIKYGQTFIESKGVTYVNKDDSLIEVYAIYDGKIINIEESDVYGVILTIEHDNKVTSHYSSLTDIKVKENDVIEKGTLLGYGTKNQFDVESGNHVSLEITVDNYYVDPVNVFTKDIKYVTDLITEGK